MRHPVENHWTMDAWKSRLRVILNRCYHLIGRALGAHRTLVGARYFREHFKADETLFILAPGTSISRFTPELFRHISLHDAIGINSFIVHRFNPQWSLFETHPPQLGLLDYLKHHPELLNETQPLYKGYCSPGKLRSVVSNLGKFRGMDSPKVMMLKDAYVSDRRIGLADVLKQPSDDRFYNYLSSVAYCLGLAYKAGYAKVVICGVDFSADYFYDDNPEYDADRTEYSFLSRTNLMAEDETLGSRVLASIESLADLFSSTRRGVVSQLGCDGPLADLLPAYELPAE